MSLFDGVHVATSLIDNLIKDNDFILNEDNGYYCFQTKDLDNFLGSFFIEEDGTFHEKKQDYKWVKGDENAKFPANLGYQEEVNESYFVEDKRACYIDFYDVYSTEEERVFVTFTAHVKDGKLTDKISVKSVERTNLKEEQERIKPYVERWEKIRSSWQWKAADKIDRVIFFINKYTLDYIRKCSNILRDSAENKY